MIGRLPIVVFGLGLCLGPALAQTGAGTPRDLIAAIYDHEQATMKKNGSDTVFSTPALRAKFFAKGFDRLVTAAETKAAHDQDVGPIDFDPIISGQDGEIKKLIVKTEKTEPTRAVVSAHFISFGDPIVVTYDCIQEDGAWKVDDIRGTADKEKWSVRALLKGTRNAQ